MIGRKRRDPSPDSLEQADDELPRDPETGDLLYEPLKSWPAMPQPDDSITRDEAIEQMRSYHMPDLDVYTVAQGDAEPMHLSLTADQAADYKAAGAKVTKKPKTASKAES